MNVSARSAMRMYKNHVTKTVTTRGTQAGKEEKNMPFCQLTCEHSRARSARFRCTESPLSGMDPERRGILWRERQPSPRAARTPGRRERQPRASTSPPSRRGGSCSGSRSHPACKVVPLAGGVPGGNSRQFSSIHGNVGSDDLLVLFENFDFLLGYLFGLLQLVLPLQDGADNVITANRGKQDGISKSSSNGLID